MPSAPASANVQPTVDPPAIARMLRRLSAAEQPPWLHGEVARRMAERLLAIRRPPQTVMQWWGHLGASDAVLRASYPKARHGVVEPTAALAARSTKALVAPWWTARHWSSPTEVLLEADAAPASAQMLWANMMLHAVADPPALLARWRRIVTAEGFLMFSTLGPDTLAGLRRLYSELGWPPAMPAFTDMHDLGDMLVQAGFADPVMDQERIVLTWATPEAMLAELRGLGANLHPARFAGLRTPRWRDRLLRRLREHCIGADGRLTMSFEVVYGHAFNALPRARVAPVTTLPVEDLRAMARTRRGTAVPRDGRR